MELTDESLVVSVNVDGNRIRFEKALVSTEKKRVIFSELSEESAGHLNTAMALNGTSARSVITYLRPERGGDEVEYQTLIARTAGFVRLNHGIDLMFYE
ncbi:MAG TPA: hypothetical protein VKZ59_04735 [Acidobacteriota bacterium]|nr:hypothetical protein [Acidobacteriota bacterium]